MSLRNLGARTRLAASFQIMSIVGGAIAPTLMGWLAEQYHSMAVCFVIPLLGFIAPTVYGLPAPAAPVRGCGVSRRAAGRATTLGTGPGVPSRVTAPHKAARSTATKT